ncbi:MAG: hypothetical protein QXH80_02310 [Candidatus Nanoarchaeia archaeon]
MKYTELRKIVIEASRESKKGMEISCKRCHEIAVNYDEKLARIGRVCQNENIKIVDCQLGCFGRRKQHG